MLSNVGCSEINERLLAAVHSGSYGEALSCLMQGAKATFVSYSCGRTAVGSAALVGDAEILQLLIQSCEEPELEMFRTEHSNTTTENEVDTTPEGMDCLEWEDEFNAGTDALNNSTNSNDETFEEFTSLYYYYAKTFERTGNIVSNLECYSSCDRNACGSSSKLLVQDPHTPDHMTMAPLHYAAVGGDVECARILLAHGAKVNVTSAVGYTPLHFGANNCEITMLLLSYGANPNAKTFCTGDTPLHAALKYHNASVVNLLLQTNKVNINEIDENDKTPLMYASTHDLMDVAMELIRKGARVNLQDKDGRTALFYAVEKNNIRLAACLLERGARHITSHYLLHQCIVYNMPEMLRLLLCHDGHFNSLKVRNPDGYTPIQLAIIYKKSDILEYMLKLDASSLASELDNDLILAVQYIETLPEFKIVSRILCSYANSTSVGSSEDAMMSSSSGTSCYAPFCHTPLSKAIMMNKMDIAEFLLKEGVSIKQICFEHVVNNLRTLSAPGCREFTRFLVYNGFRFPYHKFIKTPQKWTNERQAYESEIKQLCTQPLDLKSLARIQIRTHLIRTLSKSTVEFRSKYRATKEKSALQQMIEHLEIPTILKNFLKDFDDCESVMALYN